MIGGIIGGIIVVPLIYADTLRKSGRLHLPLPAWLYDDCVPALPSAWAALALVMPVVFVLAVVGLIFSSWTLARRYIRKERKSTAYFANVVLCFACAAIVLLFALVGRLGWYVWVIAGVLEVVLIFGTNTSVYHNFVKRVIREDQERHGAPHTVSSAASKDL